VRDGRRTPSVEPGWLFDPDFRLVLPEDPAGKEILVEPGIALQFPASAASARSQEPLRFGKRPFCPSSRGSPGPKTRHNHSFRIWNLARQKEFPFFRINEVVIASRGVSLSSDLIKEFCERGIRLSFVEPSGRPYAMLTSPILSATVENRREQLIAYTDARGLEFARIVVRGKIRNQRHLLLYSGKYLKQADSGRYGVIDGTAHQLRQLELRAR